MGPLDSTPGSGHTYQWANTTFGTPQAPQPAVSGTSQPTNGPKPVLRMWALKPEAPGHGSASQWAGTIPMTQLYPPVGLTEPQDLLYPDAAHQWADTSPRIHPSPSSVYQQANTSFGTPQTPYPTVSGSLHLLLSNLTTALKFLGPVVRLWDPALPATSPTLTPEPGFTHQW